MLTLVGLVDRFLIQVLWRIILYRNEIDLFLLSCPDISVHFRVVLKLAKVKTRQGWWKSVVSGTHKTLNTIIYSSLSNRSVNLWAYHTTKHYTAVYNTPIIHVSGHKVITYCLS